MFVTAEGPGDLDFLSWIREPGSDSPDAAIREAYEQIAKHLESRHAVLLHERIFGEVAAAPAVLSIRRGVMERIEGDPAPPPTYVEGKPCAGSGIAGIHALAVRSAGAHATSPIEWNGRVCGRLVEGAGAWYLGLSDVGQLIPGDNRERPGEETRKTLGLVEQVLDRHSWSFNDVYRTWFFLHDILDWYDEFNGVRNDAFKRLGLFDRPLGVIPASTGIQGRSARGNWCTLDLLATRPLNGHVFHVERLVNPQQNEAPEYGSAFSRGLSVTIDGCRYLFVSGTASINDQGLSVHPEDFERQTELTLETVASLLGAGGAGLKDICQATAFVKRPRDIECYRRIVRRMGLDEMPAICTIGDVCRDELLFELDATAVLPSDTVDHEAKS